MLWNNFTKTVVLKFSGMLLCILPVTASVLCYFPIWIAEGGEKIISGITVLLFALAMIPMYRGIKRLLSSPASYTLWFIAFILFFLLSHIADEMTVISFVGFIGNGMGAILFKLSERYEGRGEKK